MGFEMLAKEINFYLVAENKELNISQIIFYYAGENIETDDVFARNNHFELVCNPLAEDMVFEKIKKIPNSQVTRAKSGNVNVMLLDGENNSVKYLLNLLLNLDCLPWDAVINIYRRQYGAVPRKIKIEDKPEQYFVPVMKEFEINSEVNLPSGHRVKMNLSPGTCIGFLPDGKPFNAAEIVPLDVFNSLEIHNALYVAKSANKNFAKYYKERFNLPAEFRTFKNIFKATLFLRLFNREHQNKVPLDIAQLINKNIAEPKVSKNFIEQTIKSTREEAELVEKRNPKLM